ncbi:MAG: PTS sugar transporter subunit IIA [Beijerinckiaceae bacterium]
MDIVQLLTPDRVIFGLRAADKTQLLQELTRRASEYVNIPQKTILEGLLMREKLGSTGLGQGFALPHARIEGLKTMFGMFVKLSKPIGFEAIDGNPVDFVFLLLIPVASESDHVAALAAISRRIRDPDCAARLRKVENAPALYELLTSNNGKPC